MGPRNGAFVIMAITNSVSYTGDGTTTEFPVTFPYVSASDLVVYVDGASTAFTMTGDTVVLGTAPADNDPVIIQRVTDIELPVTVFSNDAPLLAADMNNAVEQVLYGLQDLNLIVEALETGGGGGGGAGNVPDPVAADRMIVSKSDGSGGFAWNVQTVAQVQTLLGITSPVSVPSPVAGPRFLVTNASTNTYELATISTIQSLLSVPTFNLPALNGASSHFLISSPSGSSVAWQSATYARSLLGLGTAALVNTGTSVGNVPALVSHANGPALPAVRGDNLLGLAKALDYCMWDKATNVAVGSSSGWVNLTSSMTNTIVSGSTWNRSVGTGVQVDTGTYYVKFEAYGDTGGTSTAISYRIATANGTTAPTSGTIVSISSNLGYQSVETWLVVSSSTADIALEGDSSGGGAPGTMNVQKTRLHITKVS